MREFIIPRKERLFPDSIRESTSPNEASQEAWHARNFPHNTVSNLKTKIATFQQFIKSSPQAKMYYNPLCLSTTRESGITSNKLSDTNMAEGGSDAPLLETQNRAVIKTLNNTHTSVLIDTSKEQTGTEAEGSQVQQPHRQTP